VIRLLVAAPILVLLLLFALSNTSPLRLSLWPTDYGLEAQASLIVLCAMAAAFLTGGAIVWVNELAQRRRARRAEDMVKLLEEQVRALKARLPATQIVPPSAP